MQLIKPYETANPVDEYIINDWHVWPLLKIIACMGCFIEEGNDQTFLSWFRKTKAYQFLKLLNRQRITFLYDKEKNDQHTSNRNAIILTTSARRANVNKRLFNVFSDPLVELLNAENISTLVWETGSEIFPRYSKSAWITRRLSEESNNSLQAIDTIDEPDWFASYQQFYSDINNKIISWSEINSLIDKVTIQSIVFENWFKKTDAQYLFVICWYDPIIMAALMAARNVGVKTIELQHGTQGELHYAYSHWPKVPNSGYEVVPDVFWCWGEETAEEIKKLAPKLTNNSIVVPGGNLWLNYWRHENIRSDVSISTNRIDSEAKVILVTLQENVPTVILDSIAISPHKWTWLIRYHPSWSREKCSKYNDVFNSISHPGIDLTESNGSTLYELLPKSNVHITEFSTCALEAMAFGVPSIIISEVGFVTYSEFISQGLMIPADDVSALITGVELSKSIDIENSLVNSMFSNRETSIRYLRSILD